jgi:FkbM family methyltransferase
LEEVFVDAGCFDFATSLNFIKWCGGKYKKIIAFEPDPIQYPICVENSKNINNAVIYPYGLWNEKATLSFDDTGCITNDLKENIVEIKTVKLDDILNGEKATFIKMDIEGAELNALKGAKQTILKYRPKLAICVYHKPEDIWEIPAYILSLRNDYKFYLRHYWYDTVLYAI